MTISPGVIDALTPLPVLIPMLAAALTLCWDVAPARSVSSLSPR